MTYQDPDDLVLTWSRPASQWFEATPIGNGRLGALVVGGDDGCTLLVNDSTVWSGTPNGPDDALAVVLRQGAGPDQLEQVRSAIRSGDYRTAESLLMSFEGRYTQEFLPYARLDIEHHDASSYEGRTLNLDKGVVEERFTIDGRTVRRRSWASAPDGVLCVAMSVADGVVDAELTAGSPLREVERNCGQDGIRLGVEVPIDGAPLHEPDVVPPLTYADGPPRGYDPFAALSVAVASDGEVTARNGRLAVTGMTHLVVTVASATSAERYWGADDTDRSLSREELADLATRRARAALKIGADGLLRRHVADVVPLLSAARLTVGDRRGGRIDVDAELLTSPDPAALATVLFQWGRYLLVATSRPNAGPPANLQGIWNAELRPPWSSNYTLNINTEMNYWAAETTGLGETHLPLFDLIDRLSHSGHRVAESLYGCRGWVAHHNTDMWGWSLPVGMGHGDPAWAIWQMGGVWLTHHIWDHYDFGRDKMFLATRAWPILRGCAEFCLDWLFDPGDGALDTIPSTSPENHFLTLDGETQAVSRSSTMDVALIRSLLTKTLAAA